MLHWLSRVFGRALNQMVVRCATSARAVPHDISGAPPADPERRAAEPDDRSGWLGAGSSAPSSSRALCGDARNTVAGVSAVSLTLSYAPAMHP